MTRRGLDGFGPEHNEPQLLFSAETGTPTGWSIDTSTDQDAHGPSQGTYFAKAVSGAGDKVGTATPTVTPGTYVCLSLRDYVIEGTLDSGTPTPLRFIALRLNVVVNEVYLEVLPVSASTWKLRVTHDAGRTLIGDGSTVLNTNDMTDFRLEVGNGRAKAWANGNLEVDEAYSETMTRPAIQLLGSDLSGDLVSYWSRAYVCDYSSQADRPGTDVECKRADGTSNWATEDEYGSHTDCTDTSASWINILLDGSDQINTASYWCRGANNSKQMMEVSDLTFTGDPELVVPRAIMRSNAAAKTVNVWFRAHDGSNIEEYIRNIASEDWHTVSAALTIAPGGGRWQDFTFSGLKLGIRCVDTNGAQNHIAAYIAEVLSVDDDPGPVPTVKRSLLGQSI